MAFDVIYPAHFAAVTPFSASAGSSSALIPSNSAIMCNMSMGYKSNFHLITYLLQVFEVVSSQLAPPALIEKGIL